MNWLGRIVQKHVSEEDSVLSIGCGVLQDVSGLHCKKFTGCDIYQPYVERLRSIGYDVFQADATKLELPDNSYDIVLAIDVLEHIAKEQSLAVVEKMTKWARKKVIIYTPSIFYDNVTHSYRGDPASDNLKFIAEDSESPYRGLGINQYQRHLCLYSREDLLSLGFRVNHYTLSVTEQAFFGVLEGDSLMEQKTKDIAEWWNDKHRKQSLENISDSPFVSTWECLGIEKYIRSGLNVLNIGVGTGRCTKEMKSAGIDVSAYDVSSVALDNVKRDAKACYFPSDVLPDNAFDFAVSFLVTQHMSNEDLKQQIKKVLPSLKEQGIFAMQFITAPEDDTWTSSNDSDVLMRKMGGIRRNPEQMRQIAEECGAKVTYMSNGAKAAEPSRVISYAIHMVRK